MVEAPDQLREKRVEVILQQLEDLPALPDSLSEALRLSPEQISKLVQLINGEPAIADRVVQLVRLDAPQFEITSVELAAQAVGFEALQNALIAVSIFQAFHNHPPADSPF